MKYGWCGEGESTVPKAACWLSRVIYDVILPGVPDTGIHHIITCAINLATPHGPRGHDRRRWVRSVTVQ